MTSTEGAEGGGKKWVAVRDFTSSNGEEYAEGEPWEGSDEEAEREEAAGNLRPDPAGEVLDQPPSGSAA